MGFAIYDYQGSDALEDERSVTTRFSGRLLFVAFDQSFLSCTEGDVGPRVSTRILRGMSLDRLTRALSGNMAVIVAVGSSTLVRQRCRRLENNRGPWAGREDLGVRAAVLILCCEAVLAVPVRQGEGETTAAIFRAVEILHCPITAGRGAHFLECRIDGYQRADLALIANATFGSVPLAKVHRFARFFQDPNRF